MNKGVDHHEADNIKELRAGGRMQEIMGLKRAIIIIAIIWGATFSNGAFALRVLVFSKVAVDAYRHQSISNGIQTVHEIGSASGWEVDDTIDADAFTPKNLARYDVIVWNNAGGDVLTDSQRKAFQRFIDHGGGFVGVHEAAPWSGAKPVDWPWYEKLVGARFKGHGPGTPTGKIIVSKYPNPSATGLPDPWIRDEEWYEWESDPASNPHLHILLYIDEQSYGGGAGRRPIAWCQEFGRGRSFYTALGHPPAGFDDPAFRRHLAGGIEWAAAHSPHRVRH
jgi:cytochrome c